MRLFYHYCLIGSLNEANPALGLGEDKAEALLHALVNLRDVIISGQQHLRLIKFELMRLYEIQHALRQLSYFDIPGRLKLTMQLARLTIALPVNLDKAIMASFIGTARSPAINNLSNSAGGATRCARSARGRGPTTSWTIPALEHSLGY
ncbi:hypothetical protein FS749_008961 [Ceratobasidium sp. UAMH 11750]|nr:hypothetical protein FS749_008961 [Ceratobasidium sp. UAMH 11750]